MSPDEMMDRAISVSRSNHMLMDMAHETMALMAAVSAKNAEFCMDAQVPAMKAQRVHGHAAEAQQHLAAFLKSVALMDQAGDAYLRETSEIPWDCPDASAETVPVEPGLKLVAG